MNKTRLGYCCISLGEHLSKFRTITLTRAKALGAEAKDKPYKLWRKEKLFTIWRHNLQEYVDILHYNLQNNFQVYRISSDLFPLADHEDFLSIWDDFSSDKANFNQAYQATQYVISAGFRLCAHPGQFVSLGSPNDRVRENSIKNLELHAKIFDLLGLEKTWESPLNIHLSNGKDNIKNLKYFQSSIEKLSESARSRLIFENEDKSFWVWQNIRKYFENFPVTLDFHHRAINNLGEQEKEAFDACKSSWGKFRPLMHISEGKTGKMDRTHHDWVETLPECILSDGGVDLEIEAKKKDLSVFKLRKKYAMLVI
jgi:UV DNA damage endonuclease